MNARLRSAGQAIRVIEKIEANDSQVHQDFICGLGVGHSLVICAFVICHSLLVAALALCPSV